MRTPRAKRTKIPRDPENDYTPQAAETRRAFLRAQTGAGLEHLSRYSFDPSILPGNIEHFTGVAQVPIGITGPLLVNVGGHRPAVVHAQPQLGTPGLGVPGPDAEVPVQGTGCVVPEPLRHVDRGRVLHHLHAVLGHLRAIIAAGGFPARSALPVRVLPRVLLPCGHRRLAFPRNQQDEAARGTARGKPNLIGVLEATVPSPHHRPQRQTALRAPRHQARYGVTGSTPRSSSSPAPPATCSPQPARGPGWTTRPAIRHPGTGHGAGRRTGSTPVARYPGP